MNIIIDLVMPNGHTLYKMPEPAVTGFKMQIPDRSFYDNGFHLPVIVLQIVIYVHTFSKVTFCLLHDKLCY